MFKIDLSVLIPRLIAIAAIAGVMCIILLIIRGIVKKLKQKSDLTKEHATIIRIISNIIRGVVIALAAIAILQICGIDITGAVAGLGVAGIIVSFALQDYLKDIMSGIRIINDRYFVLDDVVEFNGDIGVVVEMNIKHTKIKLISDGSIVSISNHLIESCRKYPETIGVPVEIPLSYDLPPEEADRILNAAAEKIKEIENVTDTRYDGLINFQASAVLYKIIVFCNPKNKYMVSKNSYRCVFDELLKNKISIPYDTYTVISDNNSRQND